MSPDAHGTTATAFSEGKKPDPKGHPVYDSMYVTSQISHSCRDLESTPAWGFGPREELTPVDRSVGACMVWWGCVCICQTQRTTHGKEGVEARGAGQPAGAYSTGPSRWTSSPSFCFLLTCCSLLLFLIRACLWARSFSGLCTREVVFVHNVRVAPFQNSCLIRSALISICLIIHFPQTFKIWLHSLQVC